MPVSKVLHPLVVRRLAVVDTQWLSASLRRVHLAGPELAGLVSLGPTDHAKVAFGHDGAEPVLPVLVDGRLANREDPGLVLRDETVRTHDGERLTFDLVAGDHGPASRWAATAQVGQVLGVLGPKGSKLHPLDRRHYLLAADETGLGALANWLDRLPAGTRVDAVVEVDGPDHEVRLTGAADLHLTWLHRGGAPAGTTTLLADAVAALLPEPVDPEQTYLWAGAEASAVRAIRSHVTGLGLGGSSALTGYWRLGVANFDHHSPDA